MKVAPLSFLETVIIMQHYLNHMYAPFFSQPILFQLNVECGANKSTGFIIARVFFFGVSPAFLESPTPHHLRQGGSSERRQERTDAGWFSYRENAELWLKNLRVKK